MINDGIVGRVWERCQGRMAEWQKTFGTKNNLNTAFQLKAVEREQ
jgi:hypothetical protein